MKTRLTKIALVAGGLLLALVTSSCDKWENETVESTYQGIITPDPVYSFRRGGKNSVDMLECTLLKGAVDLTYRYLHEANFTNQSLYDLARGYYENGEFGLKPREEIAASPHQRAQHEPMLGVVETLFAKTCELSGFGLPNASAIRNQPAREGKGGFLGVNIGDANLCFADEKGVVVAELFRGITDGGIYLDKILYTHLDEGLFNDEALRTAHQNAEVLPGRNYTALEHHWDLAYGYYQFWLPYTQGNGLSVLRDSKIRLYNAFARGRGALTRYRYDSVELQIKNIRTELSRVVAVRAMRMLVGENTTENLNEEIRNALFFISQGCGLLYTLPFTRKESGDAYFTPDEVTRLLSELTSSGLGLWDTARLRGAPSAEGSLQHIALVIGERYGLTLDDVKRNQ